MPKSSLRILAAFAIISVAGAAYFVPSEYQQPAATITNNQNQTPPGLPAPFSHWPKDKNPDAVLVLTGQTWGYLRPCGCSENQLGGLERRANLIALLKKKGWPTAAVDLGDVPPSTGLPDQIALKYKTAMTAMKEMGYLAVGIGREEFKNNLDNLTGHFSLQPGNEKPKLLAANLKRSTAKSRAESFPSGGPKDPPYIDDVLIAKIGPVQIGVSGVTQNANEIKPNGIDIGIAGTIESTDEMKAELKKITKEFELLSNVDALKEANRKFDADPRKPQLRVLLFQGSMDSAKKAAEAFPQFQVILCQSEQALPPLVPEKANNGKTLLINVGHKGQRAGVVGIFKQPDGSLKLEYQLIDMSEEYLTAKDPEIEKKDPILKLLQQYADEVKSSNFLDEAARKKSDHNAQIRFQGGKLKYIGSDSCKTCHPQEHAIWSKTKHSEALKYLEPKHAFRPTGRNFDPECVTCHVVGFEYTSGFENVQKTPNLQHVGCENCHGPGSGHAANPNNKQLLGFLSPWKTNPTDHLPSKVILEEIGKTEKFSRVPLEGKLTLPQRLVVQNVIKMCMGCHDPENDPKFDLYEYMPKMWHSGFKAAGGGLPPGLPPGVGK